MAIGGEHRLGGGDPISVVQPHRKDAKLGTLRNATADDVRQAVDAALAAAAAWQHLAFDERAAIFLKAADLLTGPWRATLNAATMLGQSKTAYQAEIDSACEMADFWRFNVGFALEILEEQPVSGSGVWNRLDHRPLEGFVLAITPFNFTAIAGNLPTAPALMGNTVVWKPAPTQQLAAHYTMQLLEAAGLPPGVINMVTGRGEAVSEVALVDPALPASISLALRRCLDTCGAQLRRIFGPTAHIPAWSAKPVVRILLSPIRRLISTFSGLPWSAARLSIRARSAQPRHAPTFHSLYGRSCVVIWSTK
jgi:1-pyrroline-5-carboxylate dehydrogenase